MNDEIFAALCDEIGRVAGELTVSALMEHIKQQHCNPSWAPTVDDLKQAVKEITGKLIIVHYE